ncbi:hypothetical protein [Leisingera sp. M658]|uniref:hypothetical protein n=1 Tax=Leisingera sp. M658 TaxID=2867015 RepID=UPI0021A70C58|nr:hypothetical protein [Leisingera sp. M658]UWQ77062.1 hypothetical protein K3724_00485 [Leisingera sp. M658]
MQDCQEDQFQLQLVSLVAAISLTAERHRSYPVLHYFHSMDPHASLAPAIAKIAIFLQRHRQGAQEVDPAVARPLNRAILNLLEALGRMGLTRYANDERGIDEEVFSEIVIDPLASSPNDREPSEAWLKAYVKYDGWAWEKFFHTLKHLSGSHRACDANDESLLAATVQILRKPAKILSAPQQLRKA